MSAKELPEISAHESQDPPHRAVSREPASHKVTMAVLGIVCAAVVLAVLWLFYTFG